MCYQLGAFDTTLNFYYFTTISQSLCQNVKSKIFKLNTNMTIVFYVVKSITNAQRTEECWCCVTFQPTR